MRSTILGKRSLERSTVVRDDLQTFRWLRTQEVIFGERPVPLPIAKAEDEAGLTRLRKREVELSQVTIILPHSDIMLRENPSNFSLDHLELNACIAIPPGKKCFESITHRVVSSCRCASPKQTWTVPYNQETLTAVAVKIGSREVRGTAKRLRSQSSEPSGRALPCCVSLRGLAG